VTFFRNNSKQRFETAEDVDGLSDLQSGLTLGKNMVDLPALSTIFKRVHRMSDQVQFGRLTKALLRVPVPWVFVLTYLVGVGIEAAFHRGGFLRDYQLLTPVGFVIFAVGAGLAGWGWFIFRFARTTRVPGEASTTLVTSGPYRLMRNPMYVGLSVAYVGEAVILHQIVPVVLLPLTIAYLNQVVIPVEEERLHAVFGAKYAQYQNEVRRWL
jgi:protein-S-isoprenylcysteine O-methyltransferase Ste14